jgi:zinc/manganese transport system substrate-binding protein
MVPRLKSVMLMVAVAVLLMIALLPIPEATGGAAQDEERLRVVATFSILGDVVRNVAGDAVDLTVIIGPDADAHTFEPSPEQIAALADADLIFENGIGFEGWLDDAYQASGSSATRVTVTDDLPLLEATDASGAEHSADDGHDHGDHDPHVWQDVQQVISEVGVIQEALTAADPGSADEFRSNATAYSTALQELDASIRRMVDSVPAEQRVLITSHDSLGYFAHAYGFTIAGTALGSISTEAADPSAGEIADLIEQIKSSGVPAIFAETAESDDLMSQIASDAGVELAPTLYTDTLSKSDGPAGTYIDLMTYNATTIVTALGGTAG